MKSFLPKAFFGVVALFLFAAQASAGPRPNVVLILADDLRPDGLHSLGNAVVKSPHLDSLVDRGFIFREAHIMGSMVPAVCLPSRTMLLTGQSLFRARDEASTADPSGFTFPRAMRAAGYATIHAGKWGNSPKKITDEFDESYDDKTATADADQVISFVQRYAGARPLFIYFAPNEPHDPQFADKSYYDMYRPADIPPPVDPLPFHPFDNGEMAIRDEMTLPWPRTRENVAGKLARYYASISYLDDQVGRILDALKSAGQLENTIFIVAGDNGLSLGEHGLLGKQNLYEFGGMHVPLAVAGPGIPKGASKALVYLMDIFPTVCDLTGIPTPARVEGKSLRPVVRGEAPRVREVAFTAFKDVQRAIRDERWKLIRYPQIDKTQLFDLQNDPHEMHDLASDPASSPRLQALTGELEKARRELGDTAPLTVANPKPAAWSPAQLTPAQLTAQAEETAACLGQKLAGSAEPFKAGDTVCFVGDSITRGGNYHSYINLFYATRFPGRKLQFCNCGVGGDTAGGMISNEKFRMNIDILGHKPTVATIMLGMNDIGQHDYGPDQTGPEVEQRRQHSMDLYDQNMRKLIGALQQSGAKLILITPSIYDETTKLEKAKPNVGVGRSAALAICAGKVRQWAVEYHTGLVNFQEMMNLVTTREQAKDPAFTIVGPDRVHAGAVGHMIMAYTFLKAQGMPQVVARIALDARQAAPADPGNCEITNVKAAAGGVEFDCLEMALPFVPIQEAHPAFALVPFEQDLNQETLSVAGLAPAQYALEIDGGKVGEYSAAELQSGVNLAENDRTPQHRQSAAAAKINYDLAQAMNHLRVVAEHYYTLSRAKVDLTDRAAVEKGLTGFFAEWKAAGKPIDPVAGQLLNDPDTPAKLEAKFQELTAALKAACQPQKHHFTLAKKS